MRSKRFRKVSRGSLPRLLIAAALATSAVVLSGQARAAQHPMDPLTAEEIRAAVGALRAAGRVNDDSRYTLITLHEPLKTDVLRWRPGQPVRREATVFVKDGLRNHEAVVDLASGGVTSWKEVTGVQSGVLGEEWTSAQEITKADPEWQEAVRKRGITAFEEVVCIPLTVGYYGVPEEEGKRLFKVPCFDGRGTANFWARPIEGIVPVVDIDRAEVIELTDTGVVPLPDAPADFDETAVERFREPLKPISLEQPEGSNFEVEGHLVTWQNWRFHFRIDPRLGPIISNVTYEDQGEPRSVLYQGSASELFVPYMDPDLGWYFRTYMDAGEYGIGKLAAPLEEGIDCPDNAVYFDAVFADDAGEPYTQERIACLFEQYAGDIAWRHYEAVNGESESRRRVDLVLRLISAIGNYDYYFDWVFRQDASIKAALGASGIEQVKAVQSRTVAADPDGGDFAHGTLVAPHTVAVNHDHFFSYRLDLDVDGTGNSFLRERLVTEELDRDHPRRSIWVVEPAIAKTEQQAQLRMMMDEPALWRVINPGVEGELGYPVSYQLMPGMNAYPLLSEADYPRRRAGFINHHLWVTPYDPEERYAGGTYPNQSKGDDGLPAWTSANRPIENTDIVLWYTLGFHHVVRAEDWPTLPTKWHEFELRPFNFFQRNPSLDLPKQLATGGDERPR